MRTKDLAREVAQLKDELRAAKMSAASWQNTANTRDDALNFLRAEYDGFKMGVRAALDALKLK